MIKINPLFYLFLLLGLGLIVSCGDDDDDPMDMMDNEEEEVINQVLLTFTPDNGAATVTATWFDADGDGSGAPTIEDIALSEGVTYNLTIELTNTLGSTPEDVTMEIEEEAEDHMFFFSFTDGIFADPTGNGNVDNRNDPINYNDQDANGNPLGLSTIWTAGGHTDSPGEFNVILKHQPDGQKTGSSGSAVGGTDVDITFPLVIFEEGEEEEVINQIALTFTPDNGEEAITATWFDADGEGVGSPTIDEIELEEGVTYDLAITLTNTLGMENEDVTAEIMEEDDEHMFFFSFTDGIFSDPTGDGNVDNRNDPINYNDQDDNGNPVGLSTTWTAGEHTEMPGVFNVILKHQPGLKTADSDATVGGTDVDITFPLEIVEEGHGHNEEEEVINEILLTFTPDNGEEAVTATWFDADGEGVGNPMIDEIELEEGVTYNLAITLTNTLGMEPEDVTAEIMEEDDEHMFFFSFTNGIFSDPMGDGNVDNRNDPINYNDQDANGLPVGLSTTWTAGEHTEMAGVFNVVLKHQPDLKTAMSDATVGGTDVDITFPLEIVEEGHGHNEEEEVINEILLTFTPDNGEEAVTATWFDADGDGVGNPMIDEIELEEGVTYNLAITLTNTLGMEPEDVTAEIMEEDDEHMFFFSFTDGIFSDPMGNGNVDNRNDPINYNDQDDNGFPVGLSTTWTAGEHTEMAGVFNVVLKHQPGLKTATSDATVGGTDVDITFPLEIVEEGHGHNEEEEVINQIVLTFTPTGGGDAVTATWFDADGDGVGNPMIDDINLAANTAYEMSITLTNTLGMENEDVTAEIQEEDDEHMFFFEFTTDIFSDPSGDGNVDNRNDAINYNDMDDNGFPVGLSTNWTTGGATASAGNFRVILKHQPDLKTATSDATTGGTDVDITFPINIQ